MTHETEQAAVHPARFRVPVSPSASRTRRFTTRETLLLPRSRARRTVTVRLYHASPYERPGSTAALIGILPPFSRDLVEPVLDASGLCSPVHGDSR